MTTKTLGKFCALALGLAATIASLSSRADAQVIQQDDQNPLRRLAVSRVAANPPAANAPLEQVRPRLSAATKDSWSAFEAEAYCRWAKRRLPNAAEWECAAAHMQWGHSVWEWTADVFQPYPGFTPGPYAEYSAPWFGDHRELRGGAFATHARMHDPRYRNFFQPQRSDVFAGFRSVAL